MSQERLAIPAWGTPPCTLDDWVRAFAAEGHRIEIRPEPDGMASIAEEGLGLLALADLERGMVTAIDFAVVGPDEAAILALLEAVAQRLGWELHDESDED